MNKTTNIASTLEWRRFAWLTLAIIGLSQGPPTAFAQTSFTDRDVGTPAFAGSVEVANGEITEHGGGNDIWNNSDNFHYYYTKRTGDFDCIVRVQSLTGPNTWSKAELMVRESVADGGGNLVPAGGDRFFANMATQTAGQNGVAAQWRDTRNGGASWASWPMPMVRPDYPDCWLRLQRIGDVFYAASSPDGATWRYIGALNSSWTPGGRFNGEVLVGLAVTAHDNWSTEGATAVFSDLQFLNPPSPPNPLTPVLGANGHYYEIVLVNPTLGVRIGWEEARQQASQWTFECVAGHLATITSEAEDILLEALRKTVVQQAGLLPDDVNHGHEFWVGGSQTPGADEPAGGWEWVNNEGPIVAGPYGGYQRGVNALETPFGFWGPNEPNDCNSGIDVAPGRENYLAIGRYGSRGWNDEGCGLQQIWGYVVEYEDVQPITCPANVTACNDPGKCGAVVEYPPPTTVGNCGGATFAYSPPSGSFFPVGTTPVNCIATDPNGRVVSQCSFTVTVNDCEPPVISGVSVTPSLLWPANHKLALVTVNYTASDNCGVADSSLSATSNEPDNGLGDGDQPNDIQLIPGDNHHLYLRAERSGIGASRVYAITITCTDIHGNRTTQTALVAVPHDLRH